MKTLTKKQALKKKSALSKLKKKPKDLKPVSVGNTVDVYGRSPS